VILLTLPLPLLPLLTYPDANPDGDNPDEDDDDEDDETDVEIDEAATGLKLTFDDRWYEELGYEIEEIADEG